ncbi:hypothetical protein CAEBREN_13020 [Caenorhabditis brenneri]|uniref:Uncharacterized protein n=1 Tax=Caenorhabditis brenneri TaxID=135651 RepID=G0P893_CAEBE|nr:hypothetical protein CAEBREN_13020 [Caenorhabditis brenneri]
MSVAATSNTTVSINPPTQHLLEPPLTFWWIPINETGRNGLLWWCWGMISILRILYLKTVLTPTLTPEIDLAFSRLFCDVTLITAPSSTFGWWLSYLAKRNAKTYYRDIVESKDGVLHEMRQEDFYPPSWTKLWTDPSGSIRKS